MTRVGVLGASGSVGREVVAQALDHGYEVVAISRHPDRIESANPRLIRITADVTDQAAVVAALDGCAIVFGALGVSTGDKPGVLVAGAHGIAAAAPGRVVTVGALGTGPSARAAGRFTRTLLGLVLRAELPDKIEADATVLALGGTVVHVGPMTAGPVSPTLRRVPPERVPRRFFPARISHASVAAAMLDAADAGPRGEVTVALA